MVVAKILLMTFDDTEKLGKGKKFPMGPRNTVYSTLSPKSHLSTRLLGLKFLSLLKKKKRKKVEILRVFASYFHL